MTTQLLLSDISATNTARQLKLIDYNNKKHCDCMVEVNFAPKSGIGEKQLETEFEVTWEDGSIGHYKLYDLIRVELYEVVNCFTWASHGMNSFDFVKWWISRNPQFFDLEEKATIAMGVYFYKKI